MYHHAYHRQLFLAQTDKDIVHTITLFITVIPFQNLLLLVLEMHNQFVTTHERSNQSIARTYAPFNLALANSFISNFLRVLFICATNIVIAMFTEDRNNCDSSNLSCSHPVFPRLHLIHLFLDSNAQNSIHNSTHPWIWHFDASILCSQPGIVPAFKVSINLFNLKISGFLLQASSHDLLYLLALYLGSSSLIFLLMILY